MKRYLNKFFTMLILIVMLLSTVLPAYGAESEEIPDGYEIYTVKKESGWYRIGSFSNAGIKDVGPTSIYYLDNGGNKNYPKVRRTTDWVFGANYFNEYEYYLMRGVTYYRPEGLRLVHNKESVLKQIEGMIANFVYAIANGCHSLIGMALGRNLTIDDLVFNNYSETNISFFESEVDVGENGSSLIYGDGKSGGLSEVINEWYSIFLKISLMGYMVILVYMGVKIMLASTAEKKADYKRLFVDWVIGIAILLLCPYVMKYVIKINDAFVETIEANKGYDFVKTSGIDSLDYDQNLLDVDIYTEIDWSQGEDYMSAIAFSAYMSERLALSLAFLIMTFQLVALIFHYFKRLFMIAFLIIIFPFVGLSYAIDKIADGKSQALNTWFKEFILNVFVQTFHAIVYVFVCSTVYSAGGIDTSTGDVKFDFILIIVGVTFLFQGEAIIRKIFGQESRAGTMKGMSESAAATFAKIKLVEKGVETAASYTFGRKNPIRKVARGVREYNALSARERAFDVTATTPQEYNIGDRLEHAPQAPDENASEDVKEKYKKEREYFYAAAVFNNPNSHSYQEKARALETLKNLAKENPNHDVFKDTLANAAQISAMADLDNDVQKMVAAGLSDVDIERNITARLGVVFANESDEKVRDRIKTYYTGLFLNNHSSTVSKNAIRRNVNDIIDEANLIQNTTKFADVNSNDYEENRRIAEAETLSDNRDIYAKYSGMVSEGEKKASYEYAKNIAILNQRKSGAYTEEELLRAATYVRDHANDNDITRQMSVNDFAMDADIFTHVLAKKVAQSSTASNDAIKMANREVKSYEDNPRENYFEDAISAHEVIKFKDDAKEIDDMIQRIYDKKKEVMGNAVSSMAKEYLVKNKVDIMKNSHDTTRRTQAGETREELLAKKIDVIGRTLSNLAAVNKESASSDSGAVGLSGRFVKNYLARKEEERTGILRSLEEKKAANSFTKTANEYIEEHKEERERIDREHFFGDVGDRK